jgi:predicted nucleic acid-binding protein
LPHHITVVTDVPEIRVVRDPNDDVILASAIAAGADYLVTRDKNLLSLGAYEGISIIKPETFLHVLRGQSQE